MQAGDSREGRTQHGIKQEDVQIFAENVLATAAPSGQELCAFESRRHCGYIRCQTLSPKPLAGSARQRSGSAGAPIALQTDQQKTEQRNPPSSGNESGFLICYPVRRSFGCPVLFQTPPVRLAGLSGARTSEVVWQHQAACSAAFLAASSAACSARIFLPMRLRT